MPERLKIVFRVETENRTIIVPESETWIEAESIEELARDHKQEAADFLKGRTSLSKDEKAQFDKILLDQLRAEELIFAAVEIIRRFITSKLREWAKKVVELPL